MIKKKKYQIFASREYLGKKTDGETTTKYEKQQSLKACRKSLDPYLGNQLYLCGGDPYGN
jgi:hypothetical protein